MNHRILLGATALFLSTTALPATGIAADTPEICQTPAPVLESLADHLEEDFYLPEEGAAYARYLRSVSLESDDPKDMSREVTQGLQQVFPDGHLALQYTPDANRKAEAEGNAHAAPSLPPAIAGWSMLDEDTAYIALTHFMPNEDEIAELRRAIRTFSGARNLIIDLRPTFGGDLEVIDLFTEQLFDQPEDFLWMETRPSVDRRGDSPFVDGPTVRRVDAPEGIVRQVHHVIPAADPSMVDTSLFILTSSGTASAGEHFAYAMQRSGRGVIIGENSRGAGRFGDFALLPCGYRAFIPMGQTYDPDTRFSWEGAGVAPDIPVDADDALSAALIEAGYSRSQAAHLASAGTSKS